MRQLTHWSVAALTLCGLVLAHSNGATATYAAEAPQSAAQSTEPSRPLQRLSSAPPSTTPPRPCESPLPLEPPPSAPRSKTLPHPDPSQSASLPPAPPADLRRLIGEYGTPDLLLTVYEAGGHLFADGLHLQRAPLQRIARDRFRVQGTENPLRSEHLNFEVDAKDHAIAVHLDASRLPRRDIGQEVIAVIRAGGHADPPALRAAALHAAPPVEPAASRAGDLIALATIDPSLHFDIRYATTNNFMGFPLYEHPGAYLQRPAAEALHRAAQSLLPKGYGLLIYDGYRPWFVTKMFWDATPGAAHLFVADPAQGSRHNRGCAVDLTLYDRRTGRTVTMTGRYDEMSHRSFADYVGGSSRERWLRDLLRRAMEAQGFAVYEQEWWHFDYQDWHDYAIGNVTFEQLDSAGSRSKGLPAIR